MTLSELLTDLGTKADIVHVGTAQQVGNVVDGVTKYDVPIIREIGIDLVQGASQPVAVIDQGTVDEVAYYNIRKNFTETAVRAQLFTDTQIENYLATNYPDYVVLSYTVRIMDGYDIVSVKAHNTLTDNVVSIDFAAWDDNGAVVKELV